MEVIEVMKQAAQKATLAWRGGEKSQNRLSARQANAARHLPSQTHYPVKAFLEMKVMVTRPRDPLIFTVLLKLQ